MNKQSKGLCHGRAALFGFFFILFTFARLLCLVTAISPSPRSPTEPVFLVNDTKDFQHMPQNSKVSVEMLYQYHNELSHLMQVVDYQILLQSGAYVDTEDSYITARKPSQKLAKRLKKRSANSPIISASLPDRNSTFFKNRASSKENDQNLTTDSSETASTPRTLETTVLPGVSADESTIAGGEKENEIDSKTTTELPSTTTAATQATNSAADLQHLDQNSKKPESGFLPIRRYSSSSSRRFSPLRNYTVDDCQRLTQAQLVSALKQHGTYNPDYMAWDVPGVIRFLDRAVFDQYENEMHERRDMGAVVEKNLNALERILRELDVHCDVRSPDVIAKLYNLTESTQDGLERDPDSRSVQSPTMRRFAANSGEEIGDQAANNEENTSLRDHKTQESYETGDTQREKRSSRWEQRSKFIAELYNKETLGFERSSRRDEGSQDILEEESLPGEQPQKRQPIIGQVHIVPFGCDKRGTEEDGYLRLCGACQAIRRLSDDFFPPFINEVMCDDDKACLYFYDYLLIEVYKQKDWDPNEE